MNNTSSSSGSIRKKEKGIGLREGRQREGGGESKGTRDDEDKGIAHLERSLRSLLIQNNDDDNNDNNDDDSIEIKTNRVLKLALESIERQQWRHIDELNFLDAAENSFPDLNVYKMKMNNDVNDVNDVNDDITSIERENDDTLDLLLSQYGRIVYKMNELKHLDTSRAKNLHAISKEVDDINTRKGKAYTLKQVLNISIKPNNKDKFQTSPMKHKDKKSTKQNSNSSSSSSSSSSSLSIENQIAALRDAESKALESRRNEYKFWTILDRNLSKYDSDNSKAPMPMPSNSSKAMKELEGAIGSSGYLDMLGTLEEAVQNFMIAGQISYQDMLRISSKVNSGISSDIFERSTKLMNDSGNYDTKDNEEKGNKVDNDYINIDVNSVMYRYLQSQWKVPYRDVNPALETLRGRHKDMLLKIAKATQPHSPYEFVFNNNQK